MGLTQGDYWYPGDFPVPDVLLRQNDAIQQSAPNTQASLDYAEAVILAQKLSDLMDKLSSVSLGMAQDWDNNVTIFDNHSALWHEVAKYAKVTMGDEKSWFDEKMSDPAFAKTYAEVAAREESNDVTKV